MTAPRDFWEQALSFMDAQALLTAHDLGVFDALATSPLTPARLAAARGLPVDTVARLLGLLAALRLVEQRSDGCYGNAPDVAAALVRGQPGYIGALFSYIRTVVYPAWAHLDCAVREARPQCHRVSGDGADVQRQMFEDPRQLRAFLEGMHAVTYAAAAQFARYADELRGIDTFVDVGGASGAFLIAVAERHPVTGTVFDLPAVVPIADEFIATAGLSGRLRTHSGDFWTDPLPAGADAYGLGFILHDWDDAGGDVILDRLRAAVGRGSLLVVGEHLLDETGAAPLFAVRQDVNMLVTARGRERTQSAYAAWLRRHGFVMERSYGCAFGKHYMCARRVS